MISAFPKNGLLFLLLLTVSAPCLQAQRFEPMQLSDTCQRLIFTNAGVYRPGPQVPDGPVQRVEIQRKYDREGDMLMAMVREHQLRHLLQGEDVAAWRADMDKKLQQGRPADYRTEERTLYDQRQRVIQSTLYFEGREAAQVLTRYDSLGRAISEQSKTTGCDYYYLYRDGRLVFRQGPENYQLWLYVQHGDTLQQRSYNEDSTPWFICNSVPAGHIVSYFTKAVSDVEYYEEYLFSYLPGRLTIDHYDYRPVYEEDAVRDAASEVPAAYADTLPVARPAKRARVLSRSIVFETTGSMTERTEYVYREDGREPRREAYTRFNDRGEVLEETISIMGGTALYRYAYTYDDYGNWIRQDISVDGEETIRFSPVLRRISYYQKEDMSAAAGDGACRRDLTGLTKAFEAAMAGKR